LKKNPVTGKLSFCIICLLLFTQLHAGIIKGHAFDNKTAEPIVGGTVKIDGTNFKTITGLDGSFTLKNIPSGDYTITITSVSYQTFTKDVSLTNDNDEAIVQVALISSFKNMDEVVVKKSNNRTGTTDQSARSIEKNADNILNVLSAKTIQLAPDVTVANVLRRVSGVTVDRGESGEGRYPVIRGMDKRYNYTLINGIKIPSPDDKNRYVPMDIFPSDILQRLEVIKALTPDMEGDAIGGVMNLVMKDAPEKFLLEVHGAGGYSQMLFDNTFSTYSHSAVNAKSPAEINGSSFNASYADFSKANLVFTPQKPLPDGQFGLTLGDRFFNNKLGIIVSGSYNSINRFHKEIFNEASPQPSVVFGGSQPALTDMELRNYSINDTRVALIGKIDYRINSNNKIDFSTVFTQLTTYQSRLITDSIFGSRTEAGVADVNYLDRSKTNTQSIYNATLQGLHQICKHITVDWTGAYSIATQKTPDQAELTLAQNVTPDSSGTLLLSGLDRIWQHNSDKDLAGYLNLHYKFNAGSQKFDIGVGGMDRHKERDNYYNEYSFQLTSSNVAYTNVYDAPFVLLHGNQKGTPNSPNIYTATEDVSAGYFDVRWTPNKKWNILAGVRFESTSQTYVQSADTSLSGSAPTGTVSYLDPLPSLHIKYKLNDKSAVHFSYFSSICRPGFFEIIPYQFVSEYYTEVGNDSLQHSQAQNVDVRYEYFPGGADQILVGAFYKNIQNPIEYAYERPATSSSVIKPVNGATATNVGFELVYTKYFHKFGISANYTYTYSNAPTVKKHPYKYVDSGGDTTTTEKDVTVNIPLQGQAAHIGNLSLLYKDGKSGLEIQLATIYTGRHITYLSGYDGMDYWQRGSVIMDFSAEKKLGKHFAVYAKLGNLLNTADIIEMYQNSDFLKGPGSLQWPSQNRSDRVLIQKKYYGQTYLAGIRYQF
jgi:outer membrane receptor protein involved in Fe transport